MELLDEESLEEITTTAAAPGYMTPFAFKGKKKKKKGIYGSATLKDIGELKEEGIQTEIMPWIEEKEN